MSEEEKGVKGWFDLRLRLRNFLDRDTPKYSTNPLYGLGGLALACGIIVIITGWLLSIYYEPSLEHAFESVRRISEEIPYGSVIRSIHRYGADLIIIFAIMHFLRVFFTASYRKPRDLTYIIGILAGIAIVLTSYAGYSLPLNEVSVAATYIGVGLILSIPFIGNWLTSVLLGGGGLNDILSRYYTYHLAVLPAVIVLLLLIHFYLVRTHRVSEPYSSKQDTTPVPFYPNLLLTEISAIFLLVGILIVVSSIFPVPVGERFDPTKPTGIIEPEWYLLATYALIKTGLPVFESGILFTAAILLILICIPFIDIGGNRHPKYRPFYTALGITLALEFLIFTIWGYVTPGQTIPLSGAITVGVGVAAAVFIASLILRYRVPMSSVEAEVTLPITSSSSNSTPSWITPTAALLTAVSIILAAAAVYYHVSGLWLNTALLVGLDFIVFSAFLYIYRAAYYPYVSRRIG
ncbi:MAG: cytochrome bc complex cytochrome b subunit [Nitrososphaerales archaeon]